MPAAPIPVLTGGGDPPRWLSQAEGQAEMVDAAGEESALSEALKHADAVVIDGSVDAPLSVARRAHRLVKTAQLIVVAARADHPDLNRTMLFTPGIGELWIVEPGEATTELLARAVEVGRQRRQHAARAGRVAERFARLEPPQERRRVIADQYLAVLLELLPEPVFAIDEDQRLLFRNPAAERVLALGGAPDAEGPPIGERLAPADPGSLHDLLDRGRRSLARAELELGTPPDTRFYHAAVAPVGGEREVRALVLHDVTDQVRTREQLERQRDQLEHQKQALSDALEHRSRFYASMSHELRTPINAIIGYGDLLRGEVFGSLPDEQRSALGRIHRAARHLLELVNDVLDLSKLESGKVVLESAPVDVRGLIADLEATLGPLAEEHGVELAFHAQDDCARDFHTDSRRLRQIVMNLLSNAIRFGEGAPVDVHCATDDQRLRVDVVDRGPGIPADRLDDIFEEFVQVGPTEKGGTGLGLPIARTLARALGGHLGVESTEGVGSRFFLEIPPLEQRSGDP